MDLTLDTEAADGRPDSVEVADAGGADAVGAAAAGAALGLGVFGGGTTTSSSLSSTTSTTFSRLRCRTRTVQLSRLGSSTAQRPFCCRGIRVRARVLIMKMG